MKILRKADQIYIAKRLAAIYYIAVHWNTNDIEFVEKVLGNIADIAFRVGGMDMILSDIRGAFPRDDSERANASSAIDAERQNSDMADHLCGLLKEIASQLGVGT